MDDERRHSCVFGDGDIQALRDLCALLRNGGIKTMRNVMVLAERYLETSQVIKAGVWTAIITNLVSAMLFAIWFTSRNL